MREPQGFRRPAMMAAVTGLAMACTTTPSRAQDTPVETPSANAEAEDDEPAAFRLAVDVLPEGEWVLANGTKVEAEHWQSLVLARFRKPNNPDAKVANCTGTLLGPRVFLTAAHCVDNPLGRPRIATLEVEGIVHPLACTMHPDYLLRDPKFRSPRGPEDFALCHVEYEGGVVPGQVASLAFDAVDTRQAGAAGTAVLMSGYGCSELRIKDESLDWDDSDELLRIGDAAVDSPSTGIATYLTIRSLHGTGPAVCPGDSGGPLFTGATVAAQGATRRIVGVNSSVDLTRRTDGGHDIISNIASLTHPAFENWAKQWAEDLKGPTPIVCGLTRDAALPPCRR